MSLPVSDELALAAIELLEELGEPVVIRRPGGEERDPATGDLIGSATPLEFDGHGYPGQYEADEVDGTTIHSSDTKLLLGLIAQRPQVGWEADVDGKTLRIMEAEAVRKSGQDIIYICQLRAS